MKVNTKKYFGARQLRPENLAELKQTLSSDSKEKLVNASKIEVEITPDRQKNTIPWAGQSPNSAPPISAGEGHQVNPKPSQVIPGLGSDLITPTDS